MLISESMQRVIRVLLNTKDLAVRKTAKEADISLGITVKNLNQLEKTGYIMRKRNKIIVKDFKRLLNAWAYTVSVSELKRIEFIGAEKPQYLIKKIGTIANKNKLEYAFTLFAGTELVCPLVAPSEVHLYVLEDELEKWEMVLRKQNIFPAEKGNIICFLVDKSYFYGKIKSRDINVVSYPQLYVDLFSLKGRGEEAAKELLKVMKNV